MDHSYRPNDQLKNARQKTLVLCFDGTGNKFQGNGGDSNIIKIFSMLDRQDRDVQAYYQPGIGTYVNTNSFSHTGTYAKIKSWYTKAKDSAIGTSFEQHVMAGYKFLMRFYQPGDDIYFFGFSRGAYTARFLAQMLDYVGLLSQGNEELLRFAWKTFAKWQSRSDESAEAKKQKHETYIFMQRFRDTFSIPVKRIRFLGLFDTVNSVPRFEAAWMQRSKFPYTAKSSAKVIRHAVSIDERRAKFRQDLISQKRPEAGQKKHRHHLHIPHHHHHHDSEREKEPNGTTSGSRTCQGVSQEQSQRNDRPVVQLQHEHDDDHLNLPGPSFAHASATGSTTSLVSVNSQTAAQEKASFAGEEDGPGEQDVEEVWFPGCHADIGGGWPLEKDERVSISHPPLIWMINEARKAGLLFDDDALRAAHFISDNSTGDEPYHDARQSQQPGESQLNIPVLEVDGEIVQGTLPVPGRSKPETAEQAAFKSKIIEGATKGRSHDVLQFNNGSPATAVASWNFMEYLPFRRMDLRPDGSWAPIRWPLPAGETRDIPEEAWIHNTALKRMDADPKYRPGNLIVGGGGRGMRRAPESVGKGKWKVLRGHGDLVSEIFVRAEKAGDVGVLEK